MSPESTVDQLCCDPQLLIQHYRPWLRAIAAKQMPVLLASRLDESDIVQDALLEACQDLGQFRGTTHAKLRAWLLRLLQNQLVDAVRFHRRQRRDVATEQRDAVSKLPSTGRTGSAVMHSREVHQLFWKAMAQLPDHYQTVILLRQQEDLTFDEIGRRMDRQADGVRMLWGRAVLALGNALKQLGVD